MVLLSSFWSKLHDIFNTLGSTLIAIARLFFLVAIFFLSGLQEILFSRTEIVNVGMKGLPLRCDREEALDKVAYIDKLCCENPELAEISEEFYNTNNDINPNDFDEGESEN